jgi:UDP-2,3-diacylglucosamine hydrolase
VSRLFLSDLHLADPQDAVFRSFAALLAAESAAVDEVYLLGDLCEVWFGDDDDGPLARALVEVLALASRRARVFVMRGNRDFLFGHDFAAASGVRLIPDPYPLDGRTLLAHGDAYCIDDAPYQRVRQMLRSSEWQQEVLSRTLEERRALALAMRQQSAATNANKAENIMDVSTSEVAKVMAEHGGSRLIHGHTHRPGLHLAPWGRRYVLGAWERCGWVIREDDDGELSLRCLPLLGNL